MVNLTPHKLKIHTQNGVVELPPSGEVARISTTEKLISVVEDIEIFSTEFGSVEGLAEPKPGVCYIVSRLVLEAVKNTRSDVFAPGQLIRDDQGRPIGCKGLSI